MEHERIPSFQKNRKDTAPEKRIELHCHSKMSAMDGVADVSALVNRAYEWGHSAIALTDHGVVYGFPEANRAVEQIDRSYRKKYAEEHPEATMEELKNVSAPFKVLYGCEIYLVDDSKEKVPSPEEKKADLSPETARHMPAYHAVVLVQNETGRVNLYRIISESHLKYFFKTPRVPKSLFEKYREGLLIGTACTQGELVQAILRDVSGQELASIADFYDYLEIQPAGNSAYLVGEKWADMIRSEEDIRRLNRRIVKLGETLGKPVAATGDVHFLDPEDEIFRRIIQAEQRYEDAEDQPPLYLHTTEEMLEEFSYLGNEKAREVVIDNPKMIADRCEKILPIRVGKFPPVIENSDEDLRRICYDEAHRIYGTELPGIVRERLERELNGIISNGYSVLYIIAREMVRRSNEDGYPVGSRGSVGSSFAANMAGITEVNPLPAHYLCPECHFADFNPLEAKAYAGRCGLDMPDRVCPVCGSPLRKMGFDIPYETFLGLKGNKEPDIDLNFAGEYQKQAIRNAGEIFGKEHTFRAGTIATLAERTAFVYVKDYFEEKGIRKSTCEIDRITSGCAGVRRTTGIHPGGVIVVPQGEDIHSFTPIQHPANDMNSDIITTHFDYHAIDGNLLKLDILGHDDPTMIKMLEDMTGKMAGDIPLDDSKVMSLFRSTEALGIRPEDIGGCPLGCYGIPEFGTTSVMKMLLETKPSSFSDLIHVSGLSHGTNTWYDNAEVLIREGTADISAAIGTRDDIMLYLLGKGMEREKAFTIMESVRKGRGLKPEWEDEMRRLDVPEWYIRSCRTIKYLFPKAHAAAYVMIACWTAWYKVYYPLEFYAAYFSIRAERDIYHDICFGADHLEKRINDFEAEYEAFGISSMGDWLRDLYVAREMYARGFSFAEYDPAIADVDRFTIVGGRVMPSKAFAEYSETEEAETGR